MRTLKYPKPRPKKDPKLPKPKQRTRIRGRVPVALGDYREKVKYANDIWRECVYAKEPSGICPCCRKRMWHDAAHCFTKGNHVVVRFALDNGIPLCRTCHRRVDSDHQAKLDLWMRYIGEAAYERLRLRTIGRGKTDIGLEILLLEQEAERLKAALGRWPIRPPGRGIA